MINALRYAQTLEEGGFTKEQANTNMKVIMSVVELVERGSATKQDIQLAQLATQADIQVLRSDIEKLDTKIDIIMDQMIIRFTAAFVIFSGIIIAAQKWL